MNDELSVSRWRRYGKDRLYVKRADGVQLGWCDLQTGHRHVERPEDRISVNKAIDQWQAQAERVPVPQPTPVQVQVPPARTAPLDEPVWEDLSARRAGAGVRAQAMAAKEAAPVRTVLARILNVHTEERAWRVGADGEEKVGAQLAKLSRKDPRWQSLHSLPVGERGADIDHLVVGPGGVYSLNAKRHAGAKLWVSGDTFTVNRHSQPYVHKSRHEATRAGRLLSQVLGHPVQVTGVIVPVDADELEIKSAPADVHVVNRLRLRRWLSDRPLVLRDGECQAIYDAARRSTTWSPAS